MTTIDRLSGANGPQELDALGGADPTKRADESSEAFPAGAASPALLAELDLPDLPLSMRGVSIENLLRAVSDESRRAGVQDAVDSLKQQADEISQTHAEKLKEIEKQIESSKKQSFWQKFCNVFKIIGAVVGAIASIASIAVGAATGNGLMIGAGVMGLIMTVDSIASMASDGKVSLAAGFTKAGEAMGFGEKGSQWFGFAANLLIVIAGTALTFGAAGVSAGAKAASTASEAVLSTLAKVTNVANTVESAAGVGQAVGQAGVTVAGYQGARAKAAAFDLDAILEQLRSHMKSNEKFIEKELQVSQDVMDRVRKIVADSNQTTTAILAGGATPA